MELSDLLNKTASFTIEYQDEKIQVEIYTGKLTPQYRADLVAALTAETENRKDEYATMLSDLIASWDVILNGEAFPPTYESLVRLPYQLLAQMVNQVSDFLGKLAQPKQPTT